MAELATIARPYAQALFQVASQGDVGAWGQQVQALAALAADAKLRQFADSPKVSAEQVHTLMREAAGMPLADGVSKFLRTVIDNGRLAVLPEISVQFQQLVNAGSGVSEATVYSPYPIEGQVLADLVATLERKFGRKLDTRVRLAPELIGGVRVVVGDEVLDTSVKARLDSMKAALTA